MRSICFTVLILISLSACCYVHNAIEAPAFKENVVLLLRDKGIEIQPTIYQMNDCSRAGFCEFVSDKTTIDQIVKALNLNPIVNGSTKSLINQHDLKDSNNLLVKKFMDNDQNIKGFSKEEKTPLKEAGTAFSYIYLFFDPNTNKACLFACYSYG
jgi:hypothetical protein